MKTATFALLTILMMGISTAHACKDHEGMIKDSSTSTPVPAPKSN